MIYLSSLMSSPKEESCFGETSDDGRFELILDSLDDDEESQEVNVKEHLPLSPFNTRLPSIALCKCCCENNMSATPLTAP